MNILLVRHGETMGNAQKRYIGGRTDEPVSGKGIQALTKRKGNRRNYSYSRIICSPMVRCQQTAEVFFPGVPIELVEELRECDFGIFENKNYLELAKEPRYQQWVDSNGTLPFPEGETVEGFQKRTVDAFLSVVMNTDQDLVFVVHGGTIMSIMHTFCEERENYFDWSVSNGCGFYVEFDQERRNIRVIEEVTG